MKRWIKTILILPFNVLIVIPCILLFVSNYKYSSFSITRFIVGLLPLSLGTVLAIWTMYLFKKVGVGTPAPWDPPRNLVIKGPYKIMRNPMITGVLLILLAESVLLGSKVIWYYTLIFFIINTIYFKLYEEKTLIEKFGTEYLKYKQTTPMWGIKLKRIK